MRPTVSIIIPTYNSGSFIENALDSIERQKFTQFEVLVMDSISGDDTVNIVSQHVARDNRIRLIAQKDDGIYDGMNKGISEAKGDWLLFMGSDDSLCNENVLDHVYEIIRKEKEVRFIYGNVRYFEDFENPQNHIIYDGYFSGQKLLEKNICHQAIFYHRSLFKEFGLFNTKYKFIADWDFNLRCFNSVKPLYIDELISNFYAGGKSSKFSDDIFYQDLLQNMIFTYPYDYRNEYFQDKQRMVLGLLKQSLLKFNLKKFFKASRVLLYHLKTLPADQQT